jgi:Bacterial type III secretion protein (HrpB4)
MSLSPSSVAPAGALAAEAATASSVAALLALAADKSARFVTQLHPGWAESPWTGASSWLASLDDAAAVRGASVALCGAWCVQWPSLGALADRLNRAALLPRQAVVEWLCAAALFLRRGEVRRCVGRRQREVLVEMVGQHAIQAIVSAPEAGPAPTHATPLERESMETLAAWSFAVLSAQKAWSCDHARRLIALSLPPAAMATAVRAPDRPSRILPLGGFSDQLANYFPAYSWLFGSDMDRALSA